MQKTDALQSRRLVHGLAYRIRLMAHHHEDAFRRNQLRGGSGDVLDQSAAARLMQHLGQFRLHTGAQTRSQNHNTEIKVFAHSASSESTPLPPASLDYDAPPCLEPTGSQ